MRELFFGLLLIIGSCGSVEADPLSQWSWVSPSPTGNDLHVVAFGNGLFVAAGDHGTVLTSSDGDHWQPQIPPTDRHITSMTYGNGVFVGGALDYSDSGTLCLLLSRNGTEWAQRTLKIKEFGGPIQFAGSLFFGVAPSSQQKDFTDVFVSRDGMEWPDSPSFTLPGPFYSVTYAKGAFLAAGDYGTLWKSADGFNWQQLESGIPDAWFKSFVSDENLFVAVGEYRLSEIGPPWPTAVWTSADGTIWTERASTQFSGGGGLQQLIWGAGFFVALEGYGPMLWTSSDGIGWTPGEGIQFPGSGHYPNMADSVYGNGRFVAVGKYGSIMSSTNGRNWELPSERRAVIEDLPQFTSVCYGNGLFVANNRLLATDVIMTSVDAVQWTPRLEVTRHNEPLAVNFLNGLFIATGSDALLTSTNGVTWVKAIRNWGAQDSVYGNNQFVVIGWQHVATSQDGRVWTGPRKINTRTNTTTDGLQSVAFGGGVFVATSLTGIWTSTNALDWTMRYQDESYNGSVTDAAYGAGRFVVVDQDSRYSSLDGIQWARTDGPYLVSISYGSGSFAALGNTGAWRGSRGRIYTSADGVSWTTRITVGPSLTDITFANGRFVAVGYQSILQSALVGPRLSARISPTGVFESKLLAEPGYTYEIQSSTDLNRWFPFSTNATDELLQHDTQNASTFLRARKISR